MKAILYYYRGGIERGTGNGYAWRNGYSANSEDGGVLYPWMTRKECQADAKAKGAKARFADNRTKPKERTSDQ